MIREAPTLWPNCRIKHPNNHVTSVIGLGPEPALVSQAKKLQGLSNVKFSLVVLENDEDIWMLKQVSGLSRCYCRKEAMKNYHKHEGCLVDRRTRSYTSSSE
ncbi:hypothetical protein U1Q18_008232 [Sarracenia purpurea var. burkii]